MRRRMHCQPCGHQCVSHGGMGEGVDILYRTAEEIGHFACRGGRHKRHKAYCGYTRAVGCKGPRFADAFVADDSDVELVGAVVAQRVAHCKAQREVLQGVRVVRVVDNQLPFKSLAGHGNLLSEL